MGMRTATFYEFLALAKIVGGTLVMPHTPRAAGYWEVLVKKGGNKNSRDF